MIITIVPAYSRDYNSKEAVMKDWNDNKDFQIELTGQFINKSDYERFCYNDELKFRYNKLRKAFYL